MVHTTGLSTFKKIMLLGIHEYGVRVETSLYDHGSISPLESVDETVVLWITLCKQWLNKHWEPSGDWFYTSKTTD